MFTYFGVFSLSTNSSTIVTSHLFLKEQSFVIIVWALLAVNSFLNDPKEKLLGNLIRSQTDLQNSHP